MHVHEGRLFNVTVQTIKKGRLPGEWVPHKYYVIEAEDAAEAAKVGGQFGEVLNVGFNTMRTVILKGGK